MIYGVSAFGLSKMIGLPQGQSKTYIDTFYANYPKVRQFFDQVIADCEKKGYVETMF
ncbi:MAG: hypothetical protein H6767_01500 [Candidatus Peribacteria bacterium]|nr:MAG: hypothetical protein H6767_01500 [Candidatus Peribacteria bacterium]